jgi:hypothetical protein
MVALNARYAPGLEPLLRPVESLTLDAVVVTDLQGPDARGYALADNRTAELAEWDPAQLLAELKALPEDLAAAIGWDEGEMRRVARDAEDAINAMRAELADDAVPEPPAVPVTKPGDLWLLGTHRLLCGDSTKPEDVARLMNGEKASLCASDPPYLVDYTGGDHPQSFHNDAAVKDKTWDAYVDPETSVAFFENYLRLALAHCVEGTAFYQWHAHRRQDLVDAAWKNLGLLRHQQVIWAKSRPVLTRSHLLWAHEPCVYGWLEGFPPSSAPPPPRPPCGRWTTRATPRSHTPRSSPWRSSPSPSAGTRWPARSATSRSRAAARRSWPPSSSGGAATRWSSPPRSLTWPSNVGRGSPGRRR